MQTTLAEVAKLIRSKNAGPFWLTLDVMFEDPEVYRHVRDQQGVRPEKIAQLYGLRPEQVLVFAADSALAVKASMPRVRCSGSPADSDVFGGQQYAPLLGLELTLEDAQR
jgi:Domain of unknown function (DUF4387)